MSPILRVGIHHIILSEKKKTCLGVSNHLQNTYYYFRRFHQDFTGLVLDCFLFDRFLSWRSMSISSLENEMRLMNKKSCNYSSPRLWMAFTWLNSPHSCFIKTKAWWRSERFTCLCLSRSRKWLGSQCGLVGFSDKIPLGRWGFRRRL